MVQTLSSRRHWRRELSVLLAQSATRATLSPAPCASCWPNRGRSGVMHSHGAELSSSHLWRRELSVPPAQSATPATPSPAPPRLLANRGHSEENCSKPVWIPARNIKLQQESKRETNQTNEDLVPGVTPCSCRQSTTSATESSDSKQFTEDEEQKEDEPDNKQLGGLLGHGKEDSTDA
ncbi:hypothetical protein QTO34_001339 [Cnephaeus nilssonii]|uniref:Uncharacterized protein n=1 Tax=Cnephaeus nilssonii TaxID=3371016 RepID=A0AA40HWJ3_CNENI|nr:hypothetical protein QTO34_001339 [Eptesicus nilssonii]